MPESGNQIDTSTSNLNATFHFSNEVVSPDIVQRMEPSAPGMFFLPPSTPIHRSGYDLHAWIKLRDAISSGRTIGRCAACGKPTNNAFCSEECSTRCFRFNKQWAAKIELITALGGKCSICGNIDIRTLECDHKDPATKKTCKRPSIKNAHLFQLLCGNCHNRKSWGEYIERVHEQIDAENSVRKCVQQMRPVAVKQQIATPPKPHISLSDPDEAPAPTTEVVRAIDALHRVLNPQVKHGKRKS
jgi:hypothetical protein